LQRRALKVLPLHPFLVSVATVGLGEIGDKTQLLALMLALRYRKPYIILFGILVATVLNHLLAALAGEWLRSLLTPGVLRWGVGLSLLAVAAWTLKPDQLDDEETVAPPRYGLFWLVVISFFVAEVGDKTQIATALLAARYGQVLLVVMGTTLGMMLANGPAVLFGHRMGERVPLVWVRRGAALLFGAQGLLVLLGYGVGLGSS
jgi:putative Ca2+/H+ antiporter (TMEM165/GDT1 family)